MAHDYAQDRATADSLLREYGQRGAIQRGSTSYLAIFAVMGTLQESRDGGMIQVEAMTVLLSAADLSIVPDNFDYLVLADGTLRKIKTAAPFGPAGVVVYYELTVEGP